MNRLRSLAFTGAISLLAIAMTVIFVPTMGMGEPTARKHVRRWARWSLAMMPVIAGVDYRIEGRENIPNNGALIVANHQSLWETIALFAILPSPIIVMKKELLQIPVYGWWSRLTGNIPIDREGGAKTLRRMRKDASDRIAQNCQIVVFPEGTRMAPGETTEFQPGVAGIYSAAGAPCIPVAHDSGRFWAKLGGPLNTGTITLRFLPAISPDLERRTFMALIKDRIETARPDLSESHDG